MFSGFNIEQFEIKNLFSDLGENKELFGRLVNLTAFANYLIHRVAVTRVLATKEKYAFDIFEALNTTGEPLTALETFKPIVVHTEGLDDYNANGSKEIFNQIQVYLDLKEFPESDQKQRESKELVVSFALLYDGTKEGMQLNHQRNYLRNRYEKLQNINEKRLFVKKIGALVEYKERFWIKENLEKQLYGEADRELILFSLDFIREMDNKLAIPVLARYYDSAISSGRYSEFFEVVKCITAFLVLWRAFHGGTAVIDTKYRELLAFGSKSNNIAEPKGLKYGKSFKNKLVGSDELKKYLREILNHRNLLHKNVFIGGIKEQPLYKKSKPLCKFLMLVYSHDTGIMENKKHLLEREKSGQHKNYMNITQWRNTDFSTLEHIAPVNPKKANDWDRRIYEKEKLLVNSIGNLTLLPEKVNSKIGNEAWKRKNMYYQAFSEEKLQHVEEYIDKAKKDGVDFGKKTIDLLKSNNCLPMLSAISNVKEWDSEVILERSENIGDIVSDILYSWLD